MFGHDEMKSHVARWMMTKLDGMMQLVYVTQQDGLTCDVVTQLDGMAQLVDVTSDVDAIILCDATG